MSSRSARTPSDIRSITRRSSHATRPTQDRIARLNRDLQSGAVTLPFDVANGYLRGVLAATHVPLESQLLVFSETSAQADHISAGNPRALYFDDDLAIGWVRGADTLELAALDPEQGVIFYTLPQKPADKPQFTRDNSCLLCHQIWETFGVPGLQTLSTFPMANDKAYASGLVSDHRTPFTQRWGGWFVTGRTVPLGHLGNLPVVRPATSRASGSPPALPSVKGSFDLDGYLADSSDVVALMVLEHQSRMTNLITWLGWEARTAAADSTRGEAPSSASTRSSGSTAAPLADDRVNHVVRELVDYMLFVDEAPLPRPVEGGSRFSESFSARGPKDAKGRSLRQLDLQARLFRYPCSYMIDSDAFNALPAAARQAVYARLWDVLSGADTAAPYGGALTRSDRAAIAEILEDTRPDLPAFFGLVTR